MKNLLNREQLLNESAPKDSDELINNAHKVWLNKCKKHGLFVIDKVDYNLEHATDEYAYFIVKKFADNFKPLSDDAKCTSVAHMFEIIGSDVTYLQIEMPVEDDNGKKVDKPVDIDIPQGLYMPSPDEDEDEDLVLNLTKAEAKAVLHCLKRTNAKGDDLTLAMKVEDKLILLLK